MSKKCICPVCWHEETMHARRHHEEGCYDDPRMTTWTRRPIPPGATGMAVSDRGYWHCGFCGLAMTPEKAGVFLDASLYASHPDCDAIGEDGIHEDTKIAFAGGWTDD